MNYALKLRVVDNAPRFVVGIAAVVVALAVGGCAPENGTSEEAPADVSVEDSETVASSEPVSSEGESSPAAGSVDTSIHSAVEFGEDAVLEGLSPKSWHQAGAIEHYDIARLYDKINGRSELYMAYDVVGLSWVSFVEDTDNNTFMDVFLYDMRSPTGAFGVYSVEREIDQPKVALGREGYRTDSNHYFWKGKYYVYIQASIDTEAVVSAGLSVAKALADRLDDSGGPVLGLDLVPKDGVIEDSIQYFKVDAMALDFMTETFTALYPLGDTTVKAFMSRRSSEEEAGKIVEQYAGYLEEYGDDLERKTVEGTEYIVADLGGGFYDGVFRVGSVVAGVSAVEGGADAVVAASAVIQKKLAAQ